MVNKRTIAGSMLLAATLAMTGCSTLMTHNPRTGQYGLTKAGKGAAIGAAGGAVVGGLTGGTQGALIGAGVGGVAGGVVGHNMN